MGVGTCSFSSAIYVTFPALSVDLPALFRNATLLPKELQYTLFNNEDDNIITNIYQHMCLQMCE